MDYCCYTGSRFVEGIFSPVITGTFNAVQLHCMAYKVEPASDLHTLINIHITNVPYMWHCVQMYHTSVHRVQMYHTCVHRVQMYYIHVYIELKCTIHVYIEFKCTIHLYIEFKCTIHVYIEFKCTIHVYIEFKCTIHLYIHSHNHKFAMH